MIDFFPRLFCFHIFYGSTFSSAFYPQEWNNPRLFRNHHVMEAGQEVDCFLNLEPMIALQKLNSGSSWARCLTVE